MAIELFFIEEAEKLIIDQEELEQWKSKIEELGLKGQENLYDKDKSPIPFKRLKVGEERVYAILCPNKVDVAEYKEDIIPLRVVSLIALAKKENYFGKIEIWHNFRNPDPVVIGYKSNKKGETSYYNNDGIYIIARWGDELRSFEELKQIAMKRWIAEKTDELKRMIDKHKRNLEDIEKLANNYFEGKYVYL